MRELTVRSAGFTPVKGMRHAAQVRVELDARGPVGDRAWCLVDVERATVLRTVQHPSLVAVVARTDGDLLSMTLPTGEAAEAVPAPTGEWLTCDYWGRRVGLAVLDGPHAEPVSRWLGREVRLAAAPRGGVVFAGPVTIVGTASLRDLAERSGHPGLVEQAARFRATLVVETDAPYVEETWLGAEVAAGDARLRVGGPVPRCAVLNHHPETGTRDTSLLKVLAGFVINSSNAGIGYGLTVGSASFILMIGISALELLVAVIQAYVFALLTSVYLNDAENLH
jgi:uncharacterized protein YcbX